MEQFTVIIIHDIEKSVHKITLYLARREGER